MSVLKHTWAEINEVGNIDIVQNPPEDFSNDPETIRKVYGCFSKCQNRLNEIANPMKKFVDRAKEQDEAARFYGPQTTNEILQYHEKYESLKRIVDDQLSRWLPLYLPLSEEDEAKWLIQEEEARKMERMRRQALMQLEKMEMGKVMHEEKRRERQRREMEAEKEERREKELIKEKKRAEEVDLVLDAVRTRKEEKMAKRKQMEDHVENAKGHTFSEALQMVLSKNPEAGVQSSKRALTYILTNLIKHPDAEEVRRVRVANPKLQADLFQWNGGLECLVSLGFELHDLAPPGVQNVEVQDASWFLIVDEPELIDTDAWEKWHNNFRYALNNIQNS